jgi:ribosomal protein S18 acetylase RimI-like enzyme
LIVAGYSNSNEFPRHPGSIMPRLRSFRNDDPPRLAEIWNEAFTGRGTYPLRSLNILERCVFSKPYFDSAGLIVAEDGGTPVGFVHAGFGPTDDESRIDPSRGVVCVIAVKSSHRRTGIGAELLRAAEDYLTARGTRTIQAGARWPRCPFYFGLYGGSNMPGFLDSDAATGPFLLRRGYQAGEVTAVFQRRLDAPAPTADARFVALRRRFDVRLMPRASIGSWWQESVYGLLEPAEFRLEDRLSGLPVARALLWEMEGYSWRWGCPSVGTLDVQVRSDWRRQGLAKFLLTQILRRLQEEYFGIVEAQTPEQNELAIGLLRSIGFERVDAGRVYLKEASAGQSAEHSP